MKKHGFHSMRSMLAVVIVSVAVTMAIGISLFSIHNSIRDNARQLASYRRQIESDVEKELKHETELAVSVIEEVHQMQEAGLLTEQEAKTASMPFAGGRQGKCGAVLAAEYIIDKISGQNAGELKARFEDKFTDMNKCEYT